jgi:hypothetical protein
MIWTEGLNACFSLDQNVFIAAQLIESLTVKTLDQNGSPFAF